MNPTYRRRKRRVHDRGVFGRLVRRQVIGIAIAMLVFSAGTVLFYWFSYTAGDNLFKEFVVVYKQVERVRVVSIDGKTVQQRYYETEAQPRVKRWELILAPIIINNVLVVAVLSIGSLWYTHRLAGPVYRMKNEIGRVLAGESGVRISLREKDELHELADDINRLIQRLDGARG